MQRAALSLVLYERSAEINLTDRIDVSDAGDAQQKRALFSHLKYDFASWLACQLFFMISIGNDPLFFLHNAHADHLKKKNKKIRKTCLRQQFLQFLPTTNGQPVARNVSWSYFYFAQCNTTIVLKFELGTLQNNKVYVCSQLTAIKISFSFLFGLEWHAVLGKVCVYQRRLQTSYICADMFASFTLRLRSRQKQADTYPDRVNSSLIDHVAWCHWIVRTYLINRRHYSLLSIVHIMYSSLCNLIVIN